MVTRNGFNQDGAPPGSRLAKNIIGELVSEDKINANHIVRPNDRVKIRCLDVLNTYGTSPIRFEIINRLKIEVTEVFQPNSFRPVVRFNCKLIIFVGKINNQVNCDVDSQKEGASGINTIEDNNQ